MEKEAYLLISTIFGAIVGACTTTFAAWMKSPSDLKLAQANHEHQARIEGQKLAHQQHQESRAQLREKCEEAHQLLSKIRTDTTPQASYLMRSTGTTFANEQRQQSHEDIRRLLMITDLYFPQLQEPVEALEGLTIGFWHNHDNVTFLEGVEDPERFKSDRDNALHELSHTSREIRPKVAEAKKQLREVTGSLSVASSSEVAGLADEG
jgi:hypothetical protein